MQLLRLGFWQGLQALEGVHHATVFDGLWHHLACGGALTGELAVRGAKGAVVVGEVPVLQAARGQVAGAEHVVLAGDAQFLGGLVGAGQEAVALAF
ncbi:hypothetical protein G6F32_015287 [Rhizopus arrhizus]|nr:hypothetical protein G6F32_015287 [Rhizopus arrhizus]